LALLLDNNTDYKSRRVQQIVAIKLTQQRSKKYTFQLDAARDPDDLTVGFSASF